MDYTPRSESVLRYAEQIARAHGHDYIGTEHLLLGLLAEPDGIAGQVLVRLDAAEQAAEITEEIMSSSSYTTRSRRRL